MRLRSRNQEYATLKQCVSDALTGAQGNDWITPTFAHQLLDNIMINIQDEFDFEDPHDRLNIDEMARKFGENIMPYLMKENKSVVDTVERYVERMRKIERDLGGIRARLDAPKCPTCGKKR